MDVSAFLARITVLHEYRVEGQVPESLNVSDLKANAQWVRFVHENQIVFVPRERVVEIVVR